MTTSATVQASETTEQPVPIRAHGTVLKRLGHWTQQRHIDMRASRATIVLDLRSPGIPAGDIEVSLDVDHAAVKLLVADDAVIDHDDLRRIGRCAVSDWPSTPAMPGRRIVLTGELRSAEVRVRRGGVAILSAMCSRAYLADAVQARREGRLPTIDDPTR